MKQYSYNVDGTRYDVTIENLKDGVAEMNVNGVHFNVEILNGTLAENELPDATPVAAAPAASKVSQAATATPAATEAQAPQGAGQGTPVKAPLPGVVTSINVNVGQAVKKGDTVAVLEAMKMENSITAECDGTVSGIAVSAGQSVMEGTVLLTIA